MSENELLFPPGPPGENIEQIQKEIEQLREKLRYHNRQYYVHNSPEIDDYEYDRLFTRLKELEAEHPESASPDSPTRQVGGEPLDGFTQVEHAVPMLSLDNSYNVDDLREFDARVRKNLPTGARVEYVAELKIDGVSVSLLYKDRSLFRAATRGNGRTGDDITANVRTIRSLPLKLPAGAPAGDIEVRGEVFMFRADFERVNAERQAADEPLFANPRNSTAGTLKLLDSKLTAKRPLDIFLYWLRAESLPPRPHIGTLALLETWGFRVEPNREKFDGIEPLIDFLGIWETRRHELPYETDGIVIKVNDPAQQASIGATSHHPRYAVAFKYPPEKKPTKVLAINVQVGRTGALTPVAELEPVSLSGTTVSRATLHNADEVARKDVRVGDTVIVQKAGEIIPQVIEVVLKERPPDSAPFEFPAACPVCGTPVSRPEGEVVARCVNDWCLAKLKEKARHFASRQAMDIENLGPALINQLVDKELIRDIGGLYFLKREELLELEGMAEKSVNNIVAALEKSKAPESPDRLIFALGIRHIGQRAAVILTENFDSIDSLSAATAEQLTAISEIGPTAAAAVVEFFAEEGTKNVIEKLREAGVAMKWERTSADGGPKPLEGKTFVITGTLSRARDEVKRRIEGAGGRVSSSVSAKTSYLLCGEDPGSKRDKAEKLGVKIISEQELEGLLNAVSSDE